MVLISVRAMGQGELGRPAEKQALLQELLGVFSQVNVYMGWCDLTIAPLPLLLLVHPVPHLMLLRPSSAVMPVKAHMATRVPCTQVPMYAFTPYGRLANVYAVLGLASAAVDNEQTDMARDCLEQAEALLAAKVPLVKDQVREVAKVPPRVLGALVWGKLGEVQEAERVLLATEGVPVESLTEKDLEEVMEEAKGGKERIGRPDGLERELTRIHMAADLQRLSVSWAVAAPPKK
jgi:hypothetical protein